MSRTPPVPDRVLEITPDVLRSLIREQGNLDHKAARALAEAQAHREQVYAAIEEFLSSPSGEPPPESG